MVQFRENFGENFGEISEIPKIPKKFPLGNFRKISGKFVVIFTENVMKQSENCYFYQGEINEVQGKFREKFPENFRNSENSRKFSPKISGKFPENFRKIRGFFEVKHNDTARKSRFLLL